MPPASFDYAALHTIAIRIKKGGITEKNPAISFQLLNFIAGFSS